MSDHGHDKKKKRTWWNWVEILIGKLVHSIGRTFFD